MMSQQISKDVCIGFFMETSFHYEVYRNIITELLKKKIHCELIINDLIEPAFVNDMLTSLNKVCVAGLDCMLLSVAINTGKRYSGLVSPYYIEYLKDLSDIHIRTLYGLAKNQWNHAQWNAQYDAILCYSDYTKNMLPLDKTSVHIVGNPKFDDWHNQRYSKTLPENIIIDAKKSTILYAPTYGELSSLTHWAEKLGRLGREYNLVTKLHHGTLYRQSESAALKIAKRHLKTIVSDSDITFTLLHQADYVITDNSGFIFDAINADKKTILLNWHGMETLLTQNRTFSSVDSPEQQAREFLPVVNDMLDLRRYLANDYNWQQHASRMAEIKTGYCDAFNDGKAGERAAQVIIDTLNH